MAAGDEAPVAASAPSTERNEGKRPASGETDSANQSSENNRSKRGGKKGDRGRGEWRWVFQYQICDWVGYRIYQRR
jgi:hypothetical protein